VEKLFVLLADDNDAICTLVTAILQKDFNVDIASSGSEAVECLKKRPYAAIILDLAMTDPSGSPLLDVIAAQFPALLTRIVALAANEDAQLQHAKNNGVCAILNKPIDLELLSDAVKRCTSRTGSSLHSPLVSGSMLLLLADFLQHSRWM
jgi:two-component system response regulator HydG